MPNNYFQFKQFKINQEKCAMKVGTDGVLLGAWVNLSNEKRILDIGTGTGLIALMMAQRSNALTDAVEIEQNAYRQAMENIKQSAWANRINVYHTDIKNYRNEQKYDLIISNPPYFINSLENPDIQKSTARHNRAMNYRDILDAANKFLNRNGRLAIVLPLEEGQKFQAEASAENLFCIRKTNVKPTPHKPVKRILMEFSGIQKPLIENELVIENNKRHEYSKEYIELTKDFYLNF